jgi:hypothetical protein
MPLKIPEILQQALTKPVAVFGAGLSGQGMQALLRNLGLPLVVYDQNGIEFNAVKAKDHGLVVFSPGFAPNHPWLVAACNAPFGNHPLHVLDDSFKVATFHTTENRRQVRIILIPSVRAAGNTDWIPQVMNDLIDPAIELIV